MPTDPFDLLGLPARFPIESAELERHYLAKAAELNSLPSPDDPQAAERWAMLNDARTALADPEHRACALLARLGGPPAEKDKSLPPEFLAEMMEVRESVEAAVSSGRPEDLAHWRSWASQRRRRLIAEVTRLFAELGPDPQGAPLRQIRVTLNAWRYIERLVEQLED